MKTNLNSLERTTAKFALGSLITLALLPSTVTHAVTVGCAPPPNGQISWWRGEGNANDSVDGNHGALLNDVGFTNGVVGQAFAFDGSNDRVTVSNSPSLNFGPGQDFSIEAWIRPEISSTTFGIMSIVDKRQAPNISQARGYEFNLENGRIHCRLSDSLADVGGGYGPAGPDLRDGNFHHVAMTVDRDSPTGGRLFVDGQVVLVFDPTGEPGDLSTSEPLRIGNHATPSLFAYFKGVIDEVSIYNRALESNEIAAIYAADAAGKCVPPQCTPGPPGQISWWRGEDNALDAVGANNGTLINQTTYTDSKVGKGFVFDGRDDAVQLGNPPNLQLQDFTIEGWIRRSNPSIVTYYFTLTAGLMCYGSGGYGFGIWANGYLYLGKTDVSMVTATGGAITDTNWHHVAVTKSAATVVFFVDGTAYPAAPYDPGFTFGAGVAIGARDNLAQSFLGAIDELSVYNRALTKNEIQAIYLSGSAGKCTTTPPPPACAPVPDNAISWWRGEGNTTDSVDGNHGTLTGNATYGAGRVGQGFLFDGSGDFVSVDNPANLRVQDFTIEAWIKRNSSSITTHGSYGNGVIFGYGYGGYGLYLDASGRPALSKIGINETKPGVTITDTNFHHLAVTKSGSTVVFYVDGVSYSAPAYNPGFVFSTVAAIGARGDNSDNSFLGVVDEVTVYNRALSASEIQSVYTAGGAGKCGPATPPPPPTCVPPPDSLISWWRAETNALDSVDGNHGMLLNGVGFTAGVAGQGFNFDGVDDRVTVPNSPSLNFGPNQNFSIEAWIKPQTSSTTFGIMSIVDKRLAPSISQGQGYEFNLENGRIHCRLSDSAANIGTGYGPAGPDLRDGKFHHVAVTVNRGSTDGGRLFVDGQVVLVFDPTGEPGDLSNGEPLRIGNHATPSLNAYYKGVIDEVSIYRRALRTNEIAAIYAAGNLGKCVPPPCVPSAPGQVSWWRGEANASDSVDGNHGMLENGVTFAAGKSGQAFAFDGDNDRVTIPASPSLNVGLGGGFSIETWIKPSTVALERPIVEWNSVTGGNPYPYGVHFWISVPVGYGAGPGCLYANIVDTRGSFHWLTSAGGLINTNSFQHVAVTYDKSSGLAVLYLNGAVVAQKNLGSFTPQTGYNMYLGRRPGGVAAAYSWAGLMDEVSLYSRALSQAEIQAIHDSGSTGHCKEPPMILTQPVSQKVTVGLNAAFNVAASGSPQLRYQWRFNGDNLAGATTSILTFPVGAASGGLYSVRVTNAFGSVISSNALLVVNHPPVADAGATRLLHIVPAGCSPTVVLDGSRSSDPDADPLQYRWFRTGESNAFATGVVAVVTLPMGANSLKLVVDDGLATDAQTFVVDLISPAQAVDRAITLVNSQAANPQPLLATLSAALASLQRGDGTPAVNQLWAFQNKVRAQVAPEDPALAGQFVQAAQDIIDALSRDCSSLKSLGKIGKVNRHVNGKVKLAFSAPDGQDYVVEASTNLVDWEKIGVAIQTGPGAFEFEDAAAGQLPARFYRLVKP